MNSTAAPMTLAEAHEAIDQYEQHRSECAAEAGMGAMSLGYGTDGAYAAMNYEASRFDAADLRDARRVIAEHAALAELLGVTQNFPGYVHKGVRHMAHGLYRNGAVDGSDDDLPF